jgi:hypothetical protein
MIIGKRRVRKNSKKLHENQKRKRKKLKENIDHDEEV